MILLATFALGFVTGFGTLVCIIRINRKYDGSWITKP